MKQTTIVMKVSEYNSRVQNYLDAWYMYVNLNMIFVFFWSWSKDYFEKIHVGVQAGKFTGSIVYK